MAAPPPPNPPNKNSGKNKFTDKEMAFAQSWGMDLNNVARVDEDEIMEEDPEHLDVEREYIAQGKIFILLIFIISFT